MKTIEIMTVLDTLSENMFGRSLSESIATGICVSCGKPKGEFKNYVCEAEYRITGLCQVCQDETFAILEELGE